MTHRGPFQPLLFCDSVILYVFSLILSSLMAGYSIAVKQYSIAKICPYIPFILPRFLCNSLKERRLKFTRQSFQYNNLPSTSPYVSSLAARVKILVANL